MENQSLINKSDTVLVTGANGFIGSSVVRGLLELGFQHVRCFTRSSKGAEKLEASVRGLGLHSRIEVMTGNLLSPQDCARAARNAAAIFHLAAGRGDKSFPDAYMNSVVTTRNLLQAVDRDCLKRFVNVSSFSVYTNNGKHRGRYLDETSPVEERPALRGEAYCFAKVEQEKLVADYGKKYGMPYVILRPGQVYGAGNEGITGRVGIGTFGIFLHLGGGNLIPFTYVENCAEAIIRAGLKPGIDGEIFNVVDDELPTSRKFLKLYKKNVTKFSSLYVPHFASYLLCLLWEKYSSWSKEQIPPVFNRKRWSANWRKTRYSNDKLKKMISWEPRISTEEGLKLFFASCRAKETRA